MGVKIKKIKPMFTKMIVTADTFETDEFQSGIIVNKRGDVKPYQKVLSIGSSVRDVNVDDTVFIDFSHFKVKDPSLPQNEENSIRNEFVKPVYHIELPVMEENGKAVMMIDNHDILMVADIEEYTDVPPVLVADSKKLILPKANTVKGKKKIIIP